MDYLPKKELKPCSHCFGLGTIEQEVSEPMPIKLKLFFSLWFLIAIGATLLVSGAF